MKPKTMILMGLAIVCGLGASYMTSRLLAERGTPPEEEKVKILVARRPLNVGERITKPDELFEIKEVTKENEPPDAIKEFEPLKGKIMKQSRNRGDHVTAGNLYDKDGLDIPEGHVAVGLPINLATSVHGWASLPGSRVDLTLTMRGNNPREVSSRVLLKNVLVIAADARTAREGEAIAPASVVIFALTKKDALTVNAAKEMGALTLSLRRLNEVTEDTNITPVTGATIIDGLNKQEEPKVVAQAAPPTPTPTPPPAVEVKEPEAPKGELKHLTIISGGNVTKHRFRQFENGETVEEDSQSFDGPPTPRVQPQPRPNPQPQQQPKGGKGPSRDF